MINSKIYGKNNVELVVYLKVQKYTIFVRYGNSCDSKRKLFSLSSLYFSAVIINAIDFPLSKGSFLKLPYKLMD